MHCKTIPHFLRVAILLILCLSTNCNGLGISVGPAPPPNDPVPTGTILHQATFSSLNGQTASGAAIFYSGNGVGNYILRLAGVSFPSETGLVIQIYSGSNNLVQTLQLLSSSGSKNYTLNGLGTSITFGLYSQISVYIFSTINNEPYAVAI